ncbi:hypothetical protein [Bacillus thuringiensis]|nr:hypothetical protein [Bacillus thuringiensis]
MKEFKVVDMKFDISFEVGGEGVLGREDVWGSGWCVGKEGDG